MMYKILPVLLLSLIVSCTQTPQEMIVGNWQAPDGDGSMEIFKDGGVIMRFPKEIAPGVGSVSGSWTILEDGRLKIDFSFMGESTSQLGSINFSDKDNLEITNEKGETDHFTRMASSDESVSPNSPESKNIAGVYGGKSCIYQRLEFKEGGKLYITVAGMEFPADYEVDGDRVSFSDGQGRGIVFTRQGNALHGGLAGICNKL